MEAPRDRALAWMSLLVPCLAYLLTADTDVTGGRAGELITACHTLGVSGQGPPAIQCLLGRAMIVGVPLGSVAFRVHLLSILTAGLACGLLFRVLRTGMSAPAALLSTLLVATRPAIWVAATTPTSLPLAGALLAGLAFAVRRLGSRPTTRLQLGVALLFGLGLTVDLIVLVVLPALGAALRRVSPVERATMLLLTLLGLAMGLYDPLRLRTAAYRPEPRPPWPRVFFMGRPGLPVGPRISPSVDPPPAAEAAADPRPDLVEGLLAGPNGRGGDPGLDRFRPGLLEALLAGLTVLGLLMRGRRAGAVRTAAGLLVAGAAWGAWMVRVDRAVGPAGIGPPADGPDPWVLLVSVAFALGAGLALESAGPPGSRVRPLAMSAGVLLVGASFLRELSGVMARPPATPGLDGRILQDALEPYGQLILEGVAHRSVADYLRFCEQRRPDIAVHPASGWPTLLERIERNEQGGPFLLDFEPARIPAGYLREPVGPWIRLVPRSMAPETLPRLPAAHLRWVLEIRRTPSVRSPDSSGRPLDS